MGEDKTTLELLDKVRIYLHNEQTSNPITPTPNNQQLTTNNFNHLLTLT
jgi:hypothetical protein